MKKALLLLLLPLYFQAMAQDQNENKEPRKKSFQLERMFTGGSANIGFSSGSTMLGVTPQLGYSLTDWLDAGITFNLNYVSQRDYLSEDKIRQTTYGPGAFARIFPVNFLFATMQYEYNTIQQKYISGNGGIADQKISLNANSFLVGGGYAGGRYKGSNTYYYLSVMWDISGDVNSPYVDQYGRSNPVIRAGYNIGLFQGRNRR